MIKTCIKTESKKECTEEKNSGGESIPYHDGPYEDM
jgi:hypothetical protein